MELREDVPAWRSLLFVPINREKFVAAAHTRGADAIILDCEDSVPMTEKVSARPLIPGAARQVGKSGSDVVVRINRPWHLAFEDIKAAVGPDVSALLCPKGESPEQLQVIAELLDTYEAERGLPNGHTKLLTLIETSEGFFRVRDIAKSTPRLVALFFGAEDFSRDNQMDPIPETLQMAMQTMIFAARNAGILPLGVLDTIANFDYGEPYRDLVRRSRKFGFAGTACAHPAQVPILNQEFGFSAEEVGRFERIIAAYDEAEAKGLGSVMFEGAMLDVPIVARARNMLAHAKKQARKS
jgi:citrate lyase subunit beta/citryl-CoA lyase